ncbi:FHA domain-containing protein [Kineosporia succinea]|uniref:PSer/pThr/pTyr-binding forkhead associated (FHA) protein n=1 Tax=Kineosporia succinea TaxID=84632 RepID=A0ABT9P3L5_9ACTN|nr:FHA domain-containing protein [Kineosporia succinea]MDP9827286.1 pSer/pThr/pTyr-binding forkhead associated (FHA) protein [Kineosporia succinea]
MSSPAPSALSSPDVPDEVTNPNPISPSQFSSPKVLTWVAEVWIDPDWYATQESDEPCPSPGMPAVVPLWDQSILVGRRSTSRNIHPQVDCGTDHGVSRRHAQLTTDGQRWFAEDLQSSNGTYVSSAGAPLPTAPIPAGQRVEFREGDRVYVGAWTRLVVRKATPEEQ